MNFIHRNINIKLIIEKYSLFIFYLFTYFFPRWRISLFHYITYHIYYFLLYFFSFLITFIIFSPTFSLFFLRLYFPPQSTSKWGRRISLVSTISAWSFFRLLKTKVSKNDIFITCTKLLCKRDSAPENTREDFGFGSA